MHLILVAPGLLAQSHAALAAAPSLASLAHVAPAAELHRDGIAAALLDAVGAPADTPVAPLAAMGAGIAAGTNYVLAADPVLFAADRDDLILVQRVDDLALTEAAALESTLNGHFASDGWHFTAGRPDAWFVHGPRAPAMTTTPVDAALARGVFPFLPRGADGGLWQRWQNEIGMLLNEHPVNVARQAEGRPGVTGIWFWGGGRLSEAVGLPAVATYAAAGRVGDLARGIALHAGGRANPLRPDDTRSREGALSPGAAGVLRIVVTGAIAGDDAVAAFDAQWLEPAVDLLLRRRIARLSVIGDGHGVAARWSATPPAFWRRVTTRLRRRPFAIPVSPLP